VFPPRLPDAGRSGQYMTLALGDEVESGESPELLVIEVCGETSPATNFPAGLPGGYTNFRVPSFGRGRTA